MNDIPGINLLPEHWRSRVMLALLLAPYLTRGYHALTSGGGLRGVWKAIWFGTNVPKEEQTTTK